MGQKLCRIQRQGSLSIGRSARKSLELIISKEQSTLLLFDLSNKSLAIRRTRGPTLVACDT